MKITKKNIDKLSNLISQELKKKENPTQDYCFGFADGVLWILELAKKHPKESILYHIFKAH